MNHGNRNVTCINDQAREHIAAAMRLDFKIAIYYTIGQNY